MRTNLVMKFHCSNCGNCLNIVTDYEKKELPKPKEDYLRHEPKMPSGAFMHEPSTIYIEPCRMCIERETGPAKKLREAILEMGKNG